MTIPLVVDTDGACDDALALWLMLASGSVDLSLVTTVAGAVPVEVATRNMLSLLDRLDASSVPLHVGAAAPLVQELESSEHVLGQYGMSGVRLPEPSRRPTDGSAPEALVAAGHRLEGSDAVLVALGPLTNLAAALRLDGEFLQRFGRVVVMGTATDGVGNITPDAEFNTWVDPEAAAEVFAAAGQVTVVGWRACRTASLITPSLHDRIVAAPSEFGTFLLKTSAALRQFSLDLGGDAYDLADVLAAAVVVDQSLIATTSVGHIDVDPQRRGRTVLVPGGNDQRRATIVEDADHARFSAMVDALAVKTS